MPTLVLHVRGDVMVPIEERRQLAALMSPPPASPRLQRALSLPGPAATNARLAGP